MRDKRRLRRVGWLRHGYSRPQVDQLMAHVEHRLAADEPIRASDVRRAGFDLVRHGYEVGAVDKLLDRLERRCVEQAFAAEPLWAIEDDVRRDAARLIDALSGPAGERFAHCSRLHRGYDPADVDALADRVVRTLDPFAAETASDALTADDVRFTVFKRQRAGYAEPGVDDVLDRVIDLLLRSAVLRGQLESATGDTSAFGPLGPQSFAAPPLAPFPTAAEPEPPLPAAGGAA